MRKRCHPPFEPDLIFYSSNDEDSLREAATRVGAAGYVCKGDAPALRRRVREHLAG